MIELVHTPKIASAPESLGTTGGSKPGTADPYSSQRIGYRLANAPQGIRDIYEALAAFLIGLSDDVQLKELIQTNKKVCLCRSFPRAKAVTAYLRNNPATINLEPGFTRDVLKIGHYGTGDLEVTMKTMDDSAVLNSRPSTGLTGIKDSRYRFPQQLHPQVHLRFTHRQRRRNPHHALRRPRAHDVRRQAQLQRQIGHRV
jgi:predicted transport protein